MGRKPLERITLKKHLGIIKNNDEVYSRTKEELRKNYQISIEELQAANEWLKKMREIDSQTIDSMNAELAMLKETKSNLQEAINVLARAERLRVQASIWDRPYIECKSTLPDAGSYGFKFKGAKVLTDEYAPKE